MTAEIETVEQRLSARYDEMTRAERQLMAVLMRDYPVSGLASITAIAEAAEVSTPTVARMVKKIGFPGFAEFQAALRAELTAMISDPLNKHAHSAAQAGDGHMLGRFANAVTQNITETLARIEREAFDAAVELLADTERKIHIVGGRITGPVADYLHTHLQVLRPNVARLGAAPGVWPHHLLDMKPGDVLAVFDIRRYENTLLKLAELAKAEEAEILLFTDQWSSPIAKHASQRFSCTVSAPSAWDSNVTILLLLEALVAAAQELLWEQSRARIERLEDLFDEARLFRKFT